MGVEKVFDRIETLINAKKSVLVAIDGGSGSGKTTLAEAVRVKFDCNIFHMDDFFLRPVQRTPERLKEVGGNVDYERFKSEVLDKLIYGCKFEYRPYNCKKQFFENPVAVSPKKLNVVEGAYSLHPYFGDVWELKIFVTADLGLRLKRIEARSGKELLRCFKNEWIPLEDAYFREFKIREKSDIIVQNQSRGLSLEE